MEMWPDDNWEKFFKTYRDYRVEAYFYENRRSFTLDELYHHFKARLLTEDAKQELQSGTK